MSSKSIFKNTLNIYKLTSKKHHLFNTLTSISCALILSVAVSIGSQCVMPYTAFAATNNRDIVSDTGEGMQTSSTDPILINNGDITVSGVGHARGMSGSTLSTVNYTFTNSGTINVTVSGTGNNRATGMEATNSDTGNHTLTNSGTINVVATSR